MYANCLIRLLVAYFVVAVPLQVLSKPLPQDNGSDNESSNTGTRRDIFSNIPSFLNDLCDVPFLGRLLCPPNGFLANLNIPTPLGNARGFSASPSVVRFAVKYANANRWQASTVATVWELP